MRKNQENFLILKKLIKIKKNQSDNESNAIDMDLYNHEIEIKEEVNRIEFSSSEDEVFFYIALSRTKARVIFHSKIENDLDNIDTTAEKAAYFMGHS